MKVLIVSDNFYPELKKSFKAIADTYKIFSEKYSI
jgi:hypothetical protein